MKATIPRLNFIVPHGSGRSCCPFLLESECLGLHQMQAVATLKGVCANGGSSLSTLNLYLVKHTLTHTHSLTHIQLN